MEMKTFGIIKTGYSRGIYGCSAEYFTCVYTYIEKIKGNEFNGGKDFEQLSFGYFYFKGLYGVEERVREEMKKKGYKESYIQGNFGKIPARDAYPHTKDETEALEFVRNDFKNI